jgi:hypothetical protein
MIIFLWLAAPKPGEGGNLELEISLVLGCWCLEFLSAQSLELFFPTSAFGFPGLHGLGEVDYGQER